MSPSPRPRRRLQKSPRPPKPPKPPKPSKSSKPPTSKPVDGDSQQAASLRPQAPETEAEHDGETGEPGSVAATEAAVNPFVSHLDLKSTREPRLAEIFKLEVRLLYLRQLQLEKRWAHEDTGGGVLLRTSRDHYICQPHDLPSRDAGFYEQFTKLHVKVAMTVKTPIIELFLEAYKLSHMPYIHGQRIRIMESIHDLLPNQRMHYATFVRDPPLLIVWDEDPAAIVDRVVRIEKHLVEMAWAIHWDDEDDVKDKHTVQESSAMVMEKVDTIEDEEATVWDKPRQTLLWQPLVVACAGILTVFCLSIGWRDLAIEIKTDHSWTRLLLIIASPLQLWLGWFFFMTVCTTVAQIVGPVQPMSQNTKFYSGVRSRRLRENLPHVTIQCPVYKEGLETVIHPTVISVQQAISTYELQGGSASIFVNDDGMQVIPIEEAQKRVQFYEDNNIGWVARPKHAPKGDANGQNVFIRAGKFKKASNMNYCLNVSNRVEDKMAEVERPEDWTQEDEERLYHAAFDEIIEQDHGRTWGAGDIRIGDFILLVDSDTRVPQDCLLDAVSEMAASPHVAIIQYSSGVLNVTTSFFERAITFFTNLIYTSIRFAVSLGDVAPFVGHNALLRWSAVQDIQYRDVDGTEKYWAENTVSEDFDMALRLQSLGYIIRYSTYFGADFKEGVSLTVYDELERWEKYAYGCAELVFHPFYQWPKHGPFTPLFRRFFFFSPISWMGKITIMSYVGTYFAIGSAWMLTLLNYFLLGWFNGYLDKDYAESFNVYFGLIIVFQGGGTVSLAILRYRTEGRSLLSCLMENMTWMLVICVFLGGLSLHVSGALVRYLLGIDMSWGATAKEATDTSFFREIPIIIKKFKVTFIYCILSVAMVLVLAGVGPLGALVRHDWRITSFIAIYPQVIMIGMHFLLPLVLNPGLMHFSF